MLECCILFLHYRADAESRAHLDLLRRLNPYPVVALTDEVVEPLPGSFDAARPEWGYTGTTWLNADTPAQRWYRHGGIRAERYIHLEWDAEATLPVREFYREVWNADAAASAIQLIERDPDWFWFHQVDQLPTDLRPHAAGLTPLNGFLLSDRALAAVAAAPPLPNIFCELRLGTLLRHAGFALTPFAPHRAATNQWLAEMIPRDRAVPSIYHPVKQLG